MVRRLNVTYIRSIPMRSSVNGIARSIEPSPERSFVPSFRRRMRSRASIRVTETETERKRIVETRNDAESAAPRRARARARAYVCARHAKSEVMQLFGTIARARPV